ncbi:MAG: hypothetical protein AAF485_30055, partial [Chloroflexota bacterium]
MFNSGCTFVKIEPVPPSTDPSPSLAFVTVTPRANLTARESSVDKTISPEPTPIQTPEALSPPPYFADANELGQIMVLEYHRFGYPEQRYQRTPQNFRTDLERLYQSGYYPVNFGDIVRGLPNVPPGKKPVVLTFDD